MTKKKEQLIVPLDQLLPEDLFIVPIKLRPVFPGMVTPLMISAGELAKSIENIKENTRFIGLLLQINDDPKKLDPENLYTTGTVVKIIKKINLPDGGLQLLVNTLQRFTIKKYTYRKPNIIAKVEYHPDSTEKSKEIMAFTRSLLASTKELMAENPFFTEEMKVTLVNVDEPGKVADFVCSILNLEKEEYQQILETLSVRDRLQLSLNFVARELDLLKLQRKIQGKIHDRIDNQQREYFLREQLNEIRRELGIGGDSKEKDIDNYREKIKLLNMPEEARVKALEEVDKFEYIDTHSSEYGIVRNYLDTIIVLPWATPEYKNVEINEAQKILDNDHYGLEDIKNRIIEHLAVRSLRRDNKGSIICLVGPPGVGKTSLGKSIAKAMKKDFFRFSLGGMRDEAEIKGHRRTYVGAMPGKIITALKAIKSKDPVLLLDEIDKLATSYQSDPASALLEVLDPEQNTDFRDHYLDIPFDLSHITFITTANTVETIPSPLLDRMEIIRLSGYILEEKLKIAQKYIIPKIIKKLALDKKKAPKLTVAIIKSIIDRYSREAGVRSLEKTLEKLYRKFVTALVRKTKFPEPITEEDLSSLLGTKYFLEEEKTSLNKPGIAMGLAWTLLGGATLPVETLYVLGRGKIKITGSLGKVMQESVEIALSFVKKETNDLRFWQNHDIHIHVPDGATPKDGPSAGITITSALLSLYMNKKIPKGYAMTGEINLSGNVLPIGGLKEKIIAAKRAKIYHIIFPKTNLKDWEELPLYLKKGIYPHPVTDYQEVKGLLFS